jgi:hypothetical protein
MAPTLRSCSRLSLKKQPLPVSKVASTFCFFKLDLCWGIFSFTFFPFRYIPLPFYSVRLSNKKENLLMKLRPEEKALPRAGAIVRAVRLRGISRSKLSEKIADVSRFDFLSLNFCDGMTCSLL